MPNGRLVRYCGIVTLRQQPDTANRTIFISLEDETGVVPEIVWKCLRGQQRPEVLGSRPLAVFGTWQREGDVTNLVAGRSKAEAAGMRVHGAWSVFPGDVGNNNESPTAGARN